MALPSFAGTFGAISNVVQSQIVNSQTMMEPVFKEANHLISPTTAAIVVTAYEMMKGSQFSNALMDGIINFGLGFGADITFNHVVNAGPTAEYLQHSALVALSYGYIKILRSYSNIYITSAMKYVRDDVIISFIAAILGNMLSDSYQHSSGQVVS